MARHVFTAAVVSMALLAAPLHSQEQSSADKRFFTGRDAVIFGAFVLGSAAITTFDSRVAHWWQDSVQQYQPQFRSLAKHATKVHETSLTLLGIATYAVGRLSKSEVVADIGLHATEAIVLGSVASQLIRGPLGRSRPHVTNFDDPYDFEPFKGFREFDYRAYPSIHASSSFAAATVMLAETKRRKPGAFWYVAPVAASVAIAPAFSRMYLGQHWASDIFMGAFMGTFAGLKVVNYSHDNPDNRFDRFFLGSSDGLRFSGDSRSVTVSYSRTF
ncbi:MAG TPA: phosphatase PAP2 family protein [Gemmatimonadaceae bacterium]|nr:phosphatase PAP2 family protein [Gemmatimonadaceae bacterium]